MTEVGDEQDVLGAEADARLLAWGVPSEEIVRARQSGLLTLLATAAAALPGAAVYTGDELAAKAGMDRELTKRLWRAMGFPDVADEARVFTDADAEALATVQAMLAMGFTTTEGAIQMTRVIGSSLARIAEAIIGLNDGRQSESLAMQDDVLAVAAGATVDTESRLLDYVWRRHLQAASRRRLMIEGRPDRPTVQLAVGFADLVGFTAMSQQISESELASVVDRFEALAFDQVAVHGGRVAKMIGDEVMFVVDDLGAALETALSLAEAYADDDILSDVRVGLSWGDVLAKEGDYYGPVVNLASRMVNIAFPGAVVTSDAVHREMADDPRYAFHSMRQRHLKDIGRVRLWRVRRGHPSVV